MNSNSSKYLFLLWGRILFLITLINCLLFPQNKDELKSEIDELLSNEFFKSTIAAVDVYDLTEEEYLYSKNEDLLLNPASNMKILTTAASLLFLDPDYKFTTSLYYTGQVVNNTLYGDLYIVGRGDPIFKTDDLDSLIIKIKDAGIKELSGNIYADVSWKDSLFRGSGWMWDDDPSSDAPYLSALNINNNAIKVFVAPGKEGKKAVVTIKPQTEFVEVINNTITTSNVIIDNYEINRDWINRKNTIIIDGLVENKKITDSSEVWEELNVFNPVDYFLTLFQERLLFNGITSTGLRKINTAPEYATHLADINHHIDSVFFPTNKKSNNLCAEMLFLTLGEHKFGKPANAEKGEKAINSLIDLLGLNYKNYRIADGSGVSRYNLISARLILSLLKYFYDKHQLLFQKMYNFFPIAGEDGTLEKRMKDTPAQNNVHAKTGTLSGISALSGYLTSRNGHFIAFSIVMQNYVTKSSVARDFQDRICNILFDYD